MIDGASYDVTVSRTEFYARRASRAAVLAKPGAQQVTLTTNWRLQREPWNRRFTLDGTTGAAVDSNTLLVECASGVNVARTGSRARGRQFRHGREQRTRPGRRVQLPDAHGGPVGRRKLGRLGGRGHGRLQRLLLARARPPTTPGQAPATPTRPPSRPPPVRERTTSPSPTPVTESPAEGSPVINSANCSAPGEPSTDFHGQPWLRDPLATDASLGNGGCYASRGAFARRDTLPLTFTAPALNSAGYPAGTVPYSTGVTITGDGTSAWGEPVSYTVDFGDGSSSAPATPGTALTHAYRRRASTRSR